MSKEEKLLELLNTIGQDAWTELVAAQMTRAGFTAILCVVCLFAVGVSVFTIKLMYKRIESADADEEMVFLCSLLVGVFGVGFAVATIVNGYVVYMCYHYPAAMALKELLVK